jgi:hypothetical protein
MVPRGVVADMVGFELFVPFVLAAILGTVLWAVLSPRVTLGSLRDPGGWRTYVIPTAVSLAAFWLPKSPGAAERMMLGFVAAAVAVLVQRFVMRRRVRPPA